MKAPLSVGVIGCGYWGPNLVRNFRKISNCTVRAVCDLNVERLGHLKGLYPEVETMTDFDRFLWETTLDAVAIATPVNQHYPLAKACLQAGKHVFIEKPMASSSAQCEELIEIAKQKGLILMVGHTYLYSSPVKKIVDLVEAGDI